MFLRIPIVAPAGRRLRVLVYARYSTEEQDASSIPDQYSFCERFLESAHVTNAVVDKLADAEMSGELVSRPGIDHVREGIDKHEWDLILCEDSSRLFRNVRPALELVGSAVDKYIRVLAIGDDVDTADREHWEERLIEALSHHQRSNQYVSRRIRRKHEGLWEMGAAIGLLKPGYKRQPSIPARMGESAKGPFFDEIDSRWKPIIHEAFVRIAHGEPPWSVGEWLTKQGLPKCSNAHCADWTAHRVTALIRRPDYRGLQTLRDTVAEKVHATGRRRQKKNEDAEKILTRQMPHLRIVPDSLWYRANDAIARRDQARGKRKRGPDNPLTGIPRDSRHPLSGRFFCGICKSTMHQEGRKDGGYRCSKLREKRRRCWNKASALRELSNANISGAVFEQLVRTKAQWKVLVDYCEQVAHDEYSTDRRLKEARADEQRLVSACKKLVDAMEGYGRESTDPPRMLRQRLCQREDELAKARTLLEELKHVQLRADQSQVSRKQLATAIAGAAEQLLTLDRESGVLLGQLVTRIEAIPFQQFMSNKVVLRVRFELNMANLLPMQLAALLNGETVDTATIQVVKIPMCVDLFAPSIGPKHGLEAYAL